MATVSMQLQLTNAPCTGPLQAESRFHGFMHGTKGQQAIASVTATSGGREICVGTATFMVLELPAGIRLPQLNPIDPAQYSVPLPEFAGELRPHERLIYERAQAAFAAAGDGAGFFSKLWGYEAQQTAEGASATVQNGPHIGNRVGHVQGGVLLGFAQAAASAALPPQWSATGVTAGYVSPGEGEQLTARATIVHQGRTTAVVRTEIFGIDDRRVLETISTHSLLAA
jgi:acyl-coenzyme A thioesterase PaaI-like protein